MWQAGLDDLDDTPGPVTEDRDAIGKEHCLVDVMGHQQRSEAFIGPQIEHERVEPRAA